MAKRYRFVRRLLAHSGANPKNLWKGYIFGLILLVGISSITFVTTRYNIFLFDKYAKASIVASQQSSISHAITHLSYSPEVFSGAISPSFVVRALSDYEQNHDEMIKLLQEYSPLERVFSTGVQNQIDEANSLKKHLLDYGKNLLALAISNKHENQLDKANIVSQKSVVSQTAKFTQSPDVGARLNARHDRLETILKVAEKHRADYAHSINNWFYSIAMVLLLMEAIFIFWPAHLVSSYYYLRSAKQKQKMRALVKNLSTQNQKIRIAYEQIGHDALHDALTGLANRRYLKEELQRRVGSQKDYSSELAILHIDLDRFKQVNDTMGHKAGDHVLERIADKIRSCLAPTDFVARIGGDEFVILSSEAVGKEKLSAFSKTLVDSLSQPILFEGQRCDVSASIGADLVYLSSPTMELDVSDILVNADMALYQAKQLGGCRFELFTDKIFSSHQHKISLREEIASAINRREFIPYYQLQFDAQSREIISAEALVRWRHPTRGVLPPADFLEEAIDMGFGEQIDKMMMQAALSDLSMWKIDKNCPVKSVAINLNVSSIGNPNFISSIKKLKIPRGSLSFEITETVDINRDSTQIIENVEALKELGFDIEIDDFGTGHASILSLQYLKPKRLKIDREFIFPIVESEDQRNLVKSIIQLSRPFKVAVVAEGVESLKHADILADMGCDLLQGFAFCKPIPAFGVIAMLSKNRTEFSSGNRKASRRRA